MNRFVILTFLSFVLFRGCDERTNSDSIQSDQQERILRRATEAVGMPNIRNFRERRILKDILELRDQDTVLTHTYVFSEQTGKWRWFCNSIGYGIPYATQYTNPEKLESSKCSGSCGYYTLPQADPNGLFSPSSAEGTWVMCKEPGKDALHPVYIEPKIIVTPYLLPDVGT
jgi:hypothetical protein